MFSVSQISQFYFQKSMKLFGCVPPSLSSYGYQVCTKAPKIDMMYEAERGINCTKPCAMYKMRNLAKFYASDLTTTFITIKFHELIAISKDQYSYIWLNLVAEVGGYVGLFLGFSVFQMTDLLEVLIQRKFGLAFFKEKVQDLKLHNPSIWIPESET